LAFRFGKIAGIMPNKIITVFLFVLFIATASLGAQAEASKRREVTILSVADPRGLMNPFYAEKLRDFLQASMEKIGRFSVKTFQMADRGLTLDRFVARVKELRFEKMEMAEEVRFGEQLFTRADYERMTGAFLILIPELQELRLVTNDKKDRFELFVRLRLVFLRGEDLEVAGRAELATKDEKDTEFVESQDEAFRQAAAAMMASLESQVRQVPEFLLRSTVLETRGPELVMELGSDMGLRVGDEYALTPSGKGRWEGFGREGLVMVTEVRPEASKAVVFYGQPGIGDALTEVFRPDNEYGFLATFGRRTLMKPLSGADSVYNEGTCGSFAVKIVSTRGYAAIRPYSKVSFPIYDYSMYSYVPDPWEYAFGVDYNLFLGRFQASAGAELAFALLSINFGGGPGWITWVPYGGGGATLALSYLVSRDLKVQLMGGADAYWSRPRLDPAFAGFYRYHLGVGVTMKN
jgi:hypothetical protein